MACSLAGRTTFVTTTYEFVADDAANRANFALTAIHPGAAVKQDPNGIPGAAGDDLAAVTAAGVIDVTAGKAILQETDEPAMRAARELEAALGHEGIACFTTHGAAHRDECLRRVHVPRPDRHRRRDLRALLRQRERRARHARRQRAARSRAGAGTGRSHACVETRHPAAAQQSAGLRGRARASTPDAFLASLPKAE